MTPDKMSVRQDRWNARLSQGLDAFSEFPVEFSGALIKLTVIDNSCTLDADRLQPSQRDRGITQPCTGPGAGPQSLGFPNYALTDVQA